MENLKSHILEVYKVQVDCLKGSKSNSNNKNDMKKKVNDLFKFHETTQKKLETASYSEQITIFTLILDK